MSSKKIVEGRLDNLDDGASDFVSYLNTTYIQRYGMGSDEVTTIVLECILCKKFSGLQLVDINKNTRSRYGTH